MKAQISNEFLIYFSLVILIGAYFLGQHISVNQRLKDIKMEKEADEFLEGLAFEINSAAIAGDGYERRFYLEETVGGYSNYNISTGNYFVFLDWDNRSKSASIVVESVNGEFSKGWNVIKNVDGVIYVN